MGGVDGLRVILCPPIPVSSSRVVLGVSPCDDVFDFFKMGGGRGARLDPLLDGDLSSFEVFRLVGCPWNA